MLANLVAIPLDRPRSGSATDCLDDPHHLGRHSALDSLLETPHLSHGGRCRGDPPWDLTEALLGYRFNEQILQLTGRRWSGLPVACTHLGPDEDRHAIVNGNFPE